MDILYVFASVIFLFLVIRGILFWVDLWQTKEYRLDRLLIHIKETYQGNRLLFSKILIIKVFVLLFLLIFSNNETVTFYGSLTVVAIFLIEFLVFASEARELLFHYPAFTIKAIVISVLTLFAVVVLYITPLVNNFLWLFIVDRLVVVFVSLFVLLFAIPTTLYKDWKIDRAAKKIKTNKGLIVVGVTGSYGKSSTKEFLAQLLHRNFTIVKTTGSTNTTFGIADTILSRLTNRTKLFIAEMGMYSMDEMDQMCQVIQPKIAIITGINTQHASVTGGLKGNIATKYQLVTCLPKDGFVLFNGDDENARAMYRKTRKKKELYATHERIRDTAIIAKNIKVYKTHITFDVYFAQEILRLNAPIIGGHNAINLLPAVYLAKYFGMSGSDIKYAVSRLKPFPKTMERIESPNGAVFIDDTRNNNPQAVSAAIDYLKIYKGKKIFVFQPIAELGLDGKKIHYDLGRQISKSCDFLFITNNNFDKSIMSGINDEEGVCYARVASPSKIAAFITDNTGLGDIVVFEGREAGLVLSKLL